MYVQDNSDPAIQSFTGITSVPHENYNQRNSDFDVALLRLPTELTFNDYVQPVCLPRSPAPADAACVVVGWTSRSGRRKQKTYLFPLSRIYTSAVAYVQANRTYTVSQKNKTLYSCP